MSALAWQMPAWALTLMPVRHARQCLNERASTAATATTAATAHTPARQLLVDVSVIYQSDARTGIQRVVRALLLQLLMAPPAGYRVCPIFATRQHGYRYAWPHFLDESFQDTGTAVSHMQLDVQVQSGDLFLGLDLAAHLLPRHQAQVLRWKRRGVKVHVVVYDLLPLLRPEWFKPKTVRNFKRWIKWLAVYADSAICISETVKLELHAWLNTHLGMLPTTLPASTIVLGADIEASAPSGGLPAHASSVLARLRSTTAILMVGTLEPRKGYDQALAAFEQLWQQGEDAPLLVIVGRPGWKTQALQEKLRCHPQAGQRLFWLEDVSDEYLAQLYDACSGVLVASRGEGFGLPLVEAVQHGKPVLAREIAVFQELKLAGITYFHGESANDLATAIGNWLKPAWGKTVLPPQRHASSFFPTWQLSAAQLLHALGLQCQVPEPHHSAAALKAGISNSCPMKSAA
ncbi:glycosyltransferase family 4 protein [Comamonas thiooxydans]|uniref:glycosyltransferase family 4 protein n=1 Tax=Comamonas thiooxydans TaxID=363952 RepID=UPI002114ADEC|nr:glycosyltransferase family 1 protein [Comamonas thiooxydans]UUE95603.1 glycosyltransferase family 4 protein [Comamonas thiooxydans]